MCSQISGAKASSRIHETLKVTLGRTQVAGRDKDSKHRFFYAQRMKYERRAPPHHTETTEAAQEIAMATRRRVSMSAYCLLLMLLAVLLHHRAATQSRPEGEAALLLQIKHAWGDPPVLAAWSATAASAAGAHCHWPYVDCRVRLVRARHQPCPRQN
jgi:hypothetical protein